MVEEKDEERDREQRLLEEIEEKNAKMEKELRNRYKQTEKKRKERDQNEQIKESLKGRIQILNVEFESAKRRVEEEKKEIEERMRERDLCNKDVVKAEEENRVQTSLIQSHQNQLKKLENKIQGYKTEIQKLQKLIYQLEKDKQKYGIEASQANAKYYQCLEKVKLKNNLITKLQKKNIDAESRLKQQQNLYEAVRSDRNLYSKNLLEAQEEISELKMKFRRMTQQIN